MQRGEGGRGVAMVERTPSPSRSSNFAVKRGARKTKTRKAQREDSRNALFQGGAAPCANTARQMDCSGRCVPPPHRVPSRDKSNPLFPCAVLYRVFRTSSPRNGRPPLHGRIERASMPTFFSTILRSLSRFPSFDRSPLLTAVGESCSWLVKGQRDNFTIIAYR